MAKRVMITEESVSHADLVTHIKKNWNAGLRPSMTFEEVGTDHPRMILRINAARVADILNLNIKPSIQTTEIEIKDAYETIIKQLGDNSDCLRDLLVRENTGNLVFIFTLRIDPIYIDPLDIPGADNPMDPDRQARVELLQGRARHNEGPDPNIMSVVSAILS